MRKWFSKFVYPYTVIYDNGDKFLSQELKTLLENCGSSHINLAPYSLKLNGKAERYVPTVKKSLNSTSGEGGFSANYNTSNSHTITFITELYWDFFLFTDR